MQKYAIIVAGGSGIRMGTDIPKQFLLLDNKPLLMHTLTQFYNCSNEIKIILVLPKAQINYWENLCEKYNFKIIHQIVEGGDTRFQSVKNGLNNINEKSLVAVHDGVRPLVSTSLIDNCFNHAEKQGNAIPYSIIKESIRKISGEDNVSLNRREYVTIQTPQVFYSETLVSSYQQEFKNEFTDDASVVEFYGEKINLIEGNAENIKITTILDLKYAEILLNKTI